jgi:hypothetical protein
MLLEILDFSKITSIFGLDVSILVGRSPSAFLA